MYITSSVYNRVLKFGSIALEAASSHVTAQQDAEEERTRKLAKVLTQTENPAVLKTVSSVLKGLQGVFGGKKAAREPGSGDADKPAK
jgi:hypothetical protein